MFAWAIVCDCLKSCNRNCACKKLNTDVPSFAKNTLQGLIVKMHTSFRRGCHSRYGWWNWYDVGLNNIQRKDTENL